MEPAAATEDGTENITGRQLDWKRRTVLKRTGLLACLVISGLLLSIMVNLPSILDSPHVQKNSKENFGTRFKRSGPVTDDRRERVCTSSACVNQSAAIISAMDLSVDPCQNFYKYACGRWGHTQLTDFKQVNKNSDFEDNWHRLKVEHQLTLQKILEQSPESFKSEAEKRAQRYFQTCVQPRLLTAADVDNTLLKLLIKIGGGLFNDEYSNRRYNKKSEWNFQETLQTVHNVLNVNGFFHWEMKLIQEKNLNNFTKIYAIHLSPSGLTFSRSDYFPQYNKPLAEHFNIRVEQALKSLFNISDPKFAAILPRALLSFNLEASKDKIAQRERFVNDIIEVETQIAQITPLVETENSLSLADLNMLAPIIDWNQFFQKAFSQVNITIQPSRRVSVLSTTFFREISILVQKLLANDSGQTKLKNYLFWHTVNHFYQPILKKKLGKWLEISTLQDCAAETAEAMPFAVGAMFIRKRPESEPSKHLAESIANFLKKAFKENLSSLDWLMDKETRELLADRVDATSTMIGYPELILNSTKLDQYYGDLEIKVNDYFVNNFQVGQFRFRKELIKLGQPFDKTKWTSQPFETSPFYLRDYHLVVLQSGLLYRPFFDVSFPQAINFGSLGAILGHELMHGLNPVGMLYDNNGIGRQWFNNSRTTFFKNRSECFLRQYSNYGVNGEITLDENIADNGGLKAAYTAFSNWKKTHEEVFLPYSGLKLTSAQLFFLSFAQTSCEKNSEGSIYFNHSPNHLRVTGSLSNMPEFSSAFQCPLGSLMNPRKKCKAL